MINFTLKYKYILLSILPFVCIAIYFGFIFRLPIYIISPNGTNCSDKFIIYAGSDKTDSGGNTEHKLIQGDLTKLNYQYTLRESKRLHKYMYTEVLTKDFSFIDISKYQYANIKIRAKKAEHVLFTIYSFIDNYSILNESHSHLISSKIVHVTPEYQTIKVYFKDLMTPEWWFITNKIQHNEALRPDLHKVNVFNFSHGLNVPFNEQDQIEITELSCHTDLSEFYKISSSFLFIYFLILSILKYFTSQKQHHLINFNYTKILANEYKYEEEKIVIEYIINHYMYELTISKIEQETNISDRQVSQIIKNKTDLTFNQFLNKLRITEAKRLLISSNLNVSEIAFKVGYINVTHFNRVFKLHENITPIEFKNSNK